MVRKSEFPITRYIECAELTMLGECYLVIGGVENPENPRF